LVGPHLFFSLLHGSFWFFRVFIMTPRLALSPSRAVSPTAISTDFLHTNGPLRLTFIYRRLGLLFFTRLACLFMSCSFHLFVPKDHPRPSTGPAQPLRFCSFVLVFYFQIVFLFLQTPDREPPFPPPSTPWCPHPQRQLCFENIPSRRSVCSPPRCPHSCDWTLSLNLSPLKTPLDCLHGCGGVAFFSDFVNVSSPLPCQSFPAKRNAFPSPHNFSSSPIFSPSFCVVQAWPSGHLLSWVFF